MTTMTTMHRARAIAAAVTSVLLALPAAAQAQTAVITGKITSEFGQPVDQANVYINDLTISVPTNAQGAYTITIPAARVSGQQVNLRVRAIGYQPGLRPIRITAGTQTQDFTLKQDINRLNEVVVTGTVGEGTERSKVPFAITRLTTEDIPVPALDPIQALEGKVSGVRIASANGRPGSSPEILMRGPTSINAQGRSQSPLFVVDGIVLNVGSFDELGGLDIESVEVVKGAAGASIYGATAANGVIVIKTKRGAAQDGVRFNARSEYGVNDVNSFRYRMPLFSAMQLDETGSRFCVRGAGGVAPCSRTVNWMSEILRVNSISTDTTRTAMGIQFGAATISAAGGEFLNVFEANPWPGQRFDPMASLVTPQPTTLNSLDASGRVGGVRFFASGSYTSDEGAIRELSGQQSRRGRVNLDYEPRHDATVSISTLYDRSTTDLHTNSLGLFGTILRGAKPGTDYLARDSLGRPLLVGAMGTLNGGGSLLYNQENEIWYRVSNRFLGSATASYFPSDWITFDGTFGYDTRTRADRDFIAKGYRTTSISPNTNLGNGSIGDRTEEALNGGLGASLRKQLTKDLNGKLSVRGTYEQDQILASSGSGAQFVVKDVFTLSNLSTSITATSSEQTIKRAGAFAGATAEYKDRYIIDGTFRYDGSSLFGSGNRWAPFGRVSGVWRLSEEPFFHVPHLSDFRLRASHGTAGNSPRFDAQYETYNCSATGCQLGQAGNPLLKPETTAETEVGTDLTLFDRLGLVFTFVDSKTKNQILPAPTPTSFGFGTQWQNAGTLASRTFEAEANLPVVSRRNFTWTMKGTWDRTRTWISDLFVPSFFGTGGTGQGTGSFFFFTANDSTSCQQRESRSGCLPTDNLALNRYGNIWGRAFYKGCSTLPSSVQADCGEGKSFQVNDEGWVVWVGAGNSWKDGITRNLWQTKLPAALSPWNQPLSFGHPIVMRPLRGQQGEGSGELHIVGNVMPDFRLTWNNTISYKRLTLYGLLDGTFGQYVYNQGLQWGLLDLSSAEFDQGGKSVETAKPIGYTWRVGPAEAGQGSGGFYDMLGPNNNSTEKASYAKIREASITYHFGALPRMGGDWTLGVVGRNLYTFTNYHGYDPETGQCSSDATCVTGSAILNAVDAFDFPTLRRFTVTLSTRF
jgi:TonB-linked SusC/RagA family outer membrane protein